MITQVAEYDLCLEGGAAVIIRTDQRTGADLARSEAARGLLADAEQAWVNLMTALVAADVNYRIVA